ncbi:putative sinapoylglucose--choline O-sinapoyltransferase [Helianthus debilis subsp. tardiflorus]
MDINSRFEYAHRMALISDDIYKEAIDNCDGNYVDINLANLACTNSLRSYEEVRIMNISIKAYEPCEYVTMQAVADLRFASSGNVL